MAYHSEDDTYSCYSCGFQNKWYAIDNIHGELWGCEKCGKTFCSKCFMDKHGRKEYMDMMQGCDYICCPDCWEKERDPVKSTADYIEELENKVSELGEFRSSYWGLSKEYNDLEKELEKHKDVCRFLEGENKRLRKTIERLEFELKRDRDGNRGQRQEGLLRIMKEHPELPVVPFVDAEIVADAGGYWLGSFGIVRVDEYLVPLYGDAPVMFKSDNDVFDTLEKCLSDEEFEKLPEAEGECRQIYEDLPWKKAIIAYIDLPE